MKESNSNINNNTSQTATSGNQDKSEEIVPKCFHVEEQGTDEGEIEGSTDRGAKSGGASGGTGGYTPLQETNVMTMVMQASINDNYDDDDNLMFTMGPNNDNDHVMASANMHGDEWDFEDYHDPNNMSEDQEDGHEKDMVELSVHKNEYVTSSSEGVFYTSLRNQISVNDDNGDENEKEAKQYNLLQSYSNDSDLDFNALAEKALQHLEHEYESTTKSVVSSRYHNNNDVNIETANDNNDHTTASRNIDVRVNEEELDNQQADSISTDNESPCVASLIETNAIEATMETSPTKCFEGSVFEANFEKETIDQEQPDIRINKEAISKAMRKIRINASSSLISKLDVGSSSDQQQERFQKQQQHEVNKSLYPIVHVPHEHPLIPSKALLAFQRGNTKKSIDATSRLTRSATLADAIVCLFEADKLGYSSVPSSSHQNSKNVFVVHIVGSDHVECASNDTLESAIGPFVQWWKKASSSPNTASEESQFTKFITTFEHLRIEFIGPNVPIDATKRQPLLLYPKPGSFNHTSGMKKMTLKTATAICKNCLYHDYLKEISAHTSLGEVNNKLYPHCIIAYNAGIWGYDDWNPTLQSLDALAVNSPFVITSYTVQEAEDDAEALKEILDSNSKNTNRQERGCNAADSILLGPTPNPFGSRKIRNTFSSPSSSRRYYENAAWQIWMLGSKSVKDVHK